MGKCSKVILHHKSIDIGRAVEVGTSAGAVTGRVLRSAGTVAVAVGEDDLKLVV